MEAGCDETLQKIKKNQEFNGKTFEFFKNIPFVNPLRREGFWR